MTLSRGDKSWRDEVLMIHEGTCWVVDDVRYVGDWPHAGGGSLSQLLEEKNSRAFFRTQPQPLARRTIAAPLPVQQPTLTRQPLSPLPCPILCYAFAV